MREPKKKILLGDESEEFLATLLHHPRSRSFVIKTVKKGSDCLKELSTFHPDLVVVDLMLPEIHGIEILKVVKALPITGFMKRTSQKLSATQTTPENLSLFGKLRIGVILTCYHGMVQNYRCAAKLGANYFLQKPFSPEEFFTIVDRFFEGNLKLNPFPEKKPVAPMHSPPFSNIPKESSYLKFWGTRGSNPVAGMEYIRFGGNTPTLEIRHKNDLVIIDSGSGIRGLGQELATQPDRDLHILISHTHWDHLLGFPFFLPLYQPGRNIKVFSPVGFEKTTKELFADMLAYAYFPVALGDIQSNLSFEDLRDSQTLRFGSITITTHYAFHPGSTLCFVIRIGNKKIGYVTDNEFLLGCHLPPEEIEKNESLFTSYDSLIRFLQGCDILIHEAQYTPEEYLLREGWGHSSVYNASWLVKKTGVRHWIVVHHDPRHTDAILLEKEKLHAEILQRIGHPCKLQFAYDGMLLPISV